MTDPPKVFSERQIIALDRLRLLSLAYYISGAIGAAMVSFLLIHFIVLIGISFIPASQWDQSPSKPTISQQGSPSPSAQASAIPNKNEAPPPIVFRLIAAAIGFIIVCGWILGALTAYAGYCIKKRKHKLLVLIMAAINCIWIPYGTILGIATILLFQWSEVKAEFKT